MQENTGEKPDRYNLEYLERQVYNLGQLVKINAIINSTLDIVKLLTIIMEIIKEIMDTEASTLLLYEDSTGDLVFKVALGEAGKDLQEKYRVKMGQGIGGWVAENRESLIINDTYSDRRFDPNFDKATGFKTRAMLCTPLMFKGKLLGVIQAINPLHKPSFDEEDLNLFKAFSNQAALAVQNAIFFMDALEEERIKNELSSARSIQESLLPAINRELSDIQISARYYTATEMGGEFYDISFQEDDRIRVALGDLHSKGIPGALHASMVSGAVKAVTRIKGDNPVRVLKLMNSLLAESVKTVSMMTLFYGIIDPRDKSFQYANAGFAYPLIVRDGNVKYIKIGCETLGRTDTAPKCVRVQLRAGDLFVIITDGIISLKNRYGHQLGLKRVVELLGEVAGDANDAVNALFQLADDFTDGIAKREDISVIALKMKGG